MLVICNKSNEEPNSKKHLILPLKSLSPPVLEFMFTTCNVLSCYVTKRVEIHTTYTYTFLR